MCVYVSIDFWVLTSRLLFLGQVDVAECFEVEGVVGALLEVALRGFAPVVLEDRHHAVHVHTEVLGEV